MYRYRQPEEGRGGLRAFDLSSGINFLSAQVLTKHGYRRPLRIQRPFPGAMSSLSSCFFLSPASSCFLLPPAASCFLLLPPASSCFLLLPPSFCFLLPHASYSYHLLLCQRMPRSPKPLDNSPKPEDFIVKVNISLQFLSIRYNMKTANFHRNY